MPESYTPIRTATVRERLVLAPTTPAVTAHFEPRTITPMPAPATLTPWPHPNPPTESDLEASFRAENLSPDWWGNAPGDRYPVHQHTYHKVLYCQRGSITFFLPATGERIELHPGDRLDLPPHTPHSALVGRDGVRCVEAPRWD